MKHIAMQMALFGGASLSPQVGQAVRVVPSYQVEKDKTTGKTVYDTDGDAVLVRNAQGELVITAESIRLAPRVAKDEDGNLKPDCLKAITGLEGQALMNFEREARAGLAQGRLAEFTKLISAGTHTFATAVNRRNGTKSFIIKPIFGGKSIAGADDAELLEELKRRGLSVDVKPGAPSSNGTHVEQPALPGAGDAKNTPPPQDAVQPVNTPETPAKRKARRLVKAALLQ